MPSISSGAPAAAPGAEADGTVSSITPGPTGAVTAGTTVTGRRSDAVAPNFNGNPAPTPDSGGPGLNPLFLRVQSTASTLTSKLSSLVALTVTVQPRQRLYPRSYYILIPIINIFLRCTWIFTIIPTPHLFLWKPKFSTGPSKAAANLNHGNWHSDSQLQVLKPGPQAQAALDNSQIWENSSQRFNESLLIFIVAALELYRRAQWALLRLENEHLTNASRYRAFCWVPPLEGKTTV